MECEAFHVSRECEAFPVTGGTRAFQLTALVCDPQGVHYPAPVQGGEQTCGNARMRTCDVDDAPALDGSEALTACRKLEVELVRAFKGTDLWDLGVALIEEGVTGRFPATGWAFLMPQMACVPGYSGT